MMFRCLNIILIICFVASFSIFATGCKSTKKSKIVIKHESRFEKYQKNKHTNSNVINISEDGPAVNFDYNIGPKDINNPNFDMVNIKTP